jgi:hypothetical protein
MQWSDAVAVPKPKVLRQFAVLCLIFAGSLVAWRTWQGHLDSRTEIVATVGMVIGLLGVVQPSAIRLIYTGWMIAVFPIGWTVSKLMVIGMFYVVFTPVAFIFRLLGRDALQLKRQQGTSYWSVKGTASTAEGYLRQS